MQEKLAFLIGLARSKTDKCSAGFAFVAASDPISPRCPVKLFSEYQAQIEEPHEGRLFVQYRNGKFVKQVHGKSWFSKLPFRIATFLNKQDASKFTGHSIRRTSATLLADSGESLPNLKRFGRWKSDSVAEGYIDDSVGVKRKFATELQNIQISNKEQRTPTVSTPEVPVYFNNLSNCTVTINMLQGGQQF